MGARMAAQALDGRALATHSLDDRLDTVQHRGKHLFQARRLVSGLGQQFEGLEKGLGRGCGKRLGVLHDEILSHVAFAARQTCAIYADDLHRQAARSRDFVVKHVTWVG